MHHSCQTAASFLSFTFEFRVGDWRLGKLEIKCFLSNYRNIVNFNLNHGSPAQFCSSHRPTGRAKWTALTKLLDAFWFHQMFSDSALLQDAFCSAASLSKCFKFLCLKHQPDHCGRTIVDQPQTKLIVNLQKTICSIGTHLLFMKTK